ncbi:potassium channel family protein [Litchfieldella xinjiangensis]|uniref:potassium channel family protein n=1 Tax=Litchfieldella xinjiangensis TaxID=1166948 RepID=UPI0005BCA69D|nr:potassium channel family protein [Halomonas xinjiangensis]
MHPILSLLGALLVMFTCYDAIQTTLAASKSGPMTTRLVEGIWHILLRLHRRNHLPGMLQASGPWVTMGLIISWVALIWLGWWLVFCGGTYAVVSSSTGDSASWVERAYFVGYTITTLGYGDQVPGEALWQLLSVMAAANGLLLFTLAVTYVLSIVSGVTQKRQLAVSIHTMGLSPQAMLERTRGDGDYAELAERADQLSGTIVNVGQQHLAFPIIHYYHDTVVDRSLPLALARLHQALSVTYLCCPELPGSVRLKLDMTLYAMESYINVLSRFVSPSEERPEVPPGALAPMPECDRDEAGLHACLNELDAQRYLKAYVEKDGWRWAEVWHAQ